MFNLDEIYKKLDLYEGNEIPSIEKAKKNLRIKLQGYRKQGNYIYKGQYKKTKLIIDSEMLKMGNYRLCLMRLYVEAWLDLQKVELKAKETTDSLELETLRKKWRKKKDDIKTFEAQSRPAFIKPLREQIKAKYGI